MNFTELNLKPEILEAISYMGFEEATPVQEQVIPVVMQNRDLIAVAQTGTGKTGAFVLPILNKLVGKKEHSIDTLVLVPTRELAIQIDQQIQGFSYFIPAEVIAVYGGGSGKDWDSETHAFRHAADIIIATPGRLLSHIKMGNVNLGKIKHLILDEADKMLDMGFIDDIRKIISVIPEKRQTLLFSATMPAGIRKLAKMILVNPAEVSLSASIPAEGIDQKIYMTEEKQKESLLKHILNERRHFESILIFSSTKSKINDIVRSLKRQGFQAHGISSDFEQSEREEILRNFRSKKIRILVATDVMSRGIDIKDINLIINYDVSRNQEDYVHRVGRTARVNAEGEAITLVSPKDMNSLRKIEKLIGRSIPVIPAPAGFDGQEAHKMSVRHNPGERKPKARSNPNRVWRKRKIRD
jgi:superfamily II DNA/RNA helicase